MEIFVTNKKDKLIEFFLQNPTRKIHLRELSRITRISFPWVRKLSYQMVKDNILLKNTEGGLVFLKSNRDYELFRALKRSYNLFSLHKSGLVARLNDAYERPEAIILFGSYSRGEDTEESDIDIAILTKRDKSPDLSIFGNILKRKIRIQAVRGKIEKDFLNSLANGIILSGYLELK